MSQRGYGRKRTIFLADGADAIWRRHQRFFPKAEACLDWCRVEENLWLAGTALHREGSPPWRRGSPSRPTDCAQAMSRR